MSTVEIVMLVVAVIGAIGVLSRISLYRHSETRDRARRSERRDDTTEVGAEAGPIVIPPSDRADPAAPPEGDSGVGSPEAGPQPDPGAPPQSAPPPGDAPAPPPDEGSDSYSYRADEGPLDSYRRRSSPMPSPPPGQFDQAVNGSESESIERIPHLEVPSNPKTAKGTEFEISLWLDDQPADPKAETDPVMVTFPNAIDELEVGVAFDTSPHLEILDEPFRRLVIERKRVKGEVVTVRLRVDDPGADGPATVSALFIYAGRPCGRVARAWAWGADHGEPIEPHAALARSVPIVPETPEPDLTVLIDGGKDGLNFRVPSSPACCPASRLRSGATGRFPWVRGS